MGSLFYSVQKDLMDFCDAVKLLSDAVNGCGIDWKDEKYRELSEKIQTIARSSTKIVRSGEESREALQEFERIAGEE